MKRPATVPQVARNQEGVDSCVLCFVVLVEDEEVVRKVPKQVRYKEMDGVHRHQELGPHGIFYRLSDTRICIKSAW